MYEIHEYAVHELNRYMIYFEYFIRKKSREIKSYFNCDLFLLLCKIKLHFQSLIYI